ncbi:hypothetical protein SAMN05444412_12312 [Rhodonellum ikkaensis]|uniref:Uncharacterized protein n=1 Tax=Rhodonellum ikkaensis TaxID=336829 RepID=A0A1H3U0P9_9BACT|nr:hypothetical protein SAMN05444412_12312 [Rhodonellum ikkaensis]
MRNWTAGLFFVVFGMGYFVLDRYLEIITSCFSKNPVRRSDKDTATLV